MSAGRRADILRADSSAWLIVAMVVAVLALIVGLLLLVGADPELTAHAMWRATFGSLRNFGETLLRATPLLMIAATLVPSLRVGLYNIGAPGQMGMGALAATLVALALPHESKWVVVPACAAVGGLAGSATSVIAGFLKARWKVNEIVPTLALNFIVVSILGYLLNGPMKSNFANLPQSNALPASAGLPIVLSGTRVHIGLLIALVAAIGLYIVGRSLIGYRLRLLGANVTLAKRALVDPGRYIMGLFAVAGAGAGLAGWMQVAAVDHRLYTSLAAPVGYSGLFVALLGGLHPLGIVLASFFLGALLHGGEALQVGANVSPELVDVLLGLVLYAYAVRPRMSAATPSKD